jgi:hypothetical protein
MKAMLADGQHRFSLYLDFIHLRVKSREERRPNATTNSAISDPKNN